MNTQKILLTCSLGVLLPLFISSCGGGDDDSKGVSLIPLTTPKNVKALSGDKVVDLTWGIVTVATKYSVCYAREHISEFENCSVFRSGKLLQDVKSPNKRIEGLLNDSEYFFRVIAIDTEENKSKQSIEVKAIPKNSKTSLNKLNDTGLTKCVNSTSYNLPCPIITHPNQDAESGRDFTHNDDTDGYAGFSYTKISNSGVELPNSATKWACVKDNITGLIWEVKTDNDTGLHSKNIVRYWYDSNNNTNGGYSGKNHKGSTNSFINDVNKSSLCGFNDWRLPNRKELNSIVSYRFHFLDGLIEKEYFPMTFTGDNYPVYWTSYTNAGNKSYVWAVNFRSGHTVIKNKDEFSFIRLVRKFRE